MKQRAHRILLAACTVLGAAAAALASGADPLEGDASPAAALVPERTATAALALNDPICLRCHWCPVGEDRRGDGLPATLAGSPAPEDPPPFLRP